MWLRIRDANTDIEYGIFSSSEFGYDANRGCYTVTFKLNTINNSLLIGNYYKIQIAYEDRETMDAGTTPGSGTIGYYSTVAITKCTAQPEIFITNLDDMISNTNADQYIGIYRNQLDPSEKNHQYLFELTNAAGDIITSTDWLYHNANRDTVSYESSDIYNLLYSIDSSEVVYLRYKVKTNNGLSLQSPRYPIVERGGVNSSLTAKLSATLDYDNGCISVYLEPDQIAILQSGLNNNETNTSYVGKFVLSRSSSIDNYNIWLPLYTFELTGNLPSGNLFTDFTGQQGETYQYCIQQYNANQIYSSRIYSDKILMQFEDSYLYDGKRQLRIRFNPKVSSFKTVVQESKKTTLGAQYPFFFKSGNVQYKEFPIQGLISYMMDDNEYFVSKENDLLMPSNWDDSFDITDDNLTYERRFRLKVLEWLNDGGLKLFRSPAEGNYLVRLMSVSLSPNDSVSRMIATFSCTATEAAECTTENLNDLGFLDVDLSIPEVLQFYTIDLMNLTTSNNINTVKNLDLLEGFSCQYIKIEGVDPLGINPDGAGQVSFSANSTTSTSTAFFSFGEGSTKETYTVGITGQYEATFTKQKKILKLVNPYKGMPGTITVGILAQNTSWFDNITEVSSVDRFDSFDYIGINWVSLHQGKHYTAWGENDYYNSKDILTKIYLAEFELNSSVYQVESLENLAQIYNLYLTPSNASYSSQHPNWPHNTYTRYEAKFLTQGHNASDLFKDGAIFVTQHHFDRNGNDEGVTVWKYYSRSASQPSTSSQYIEGYFLRVTNSVITTELDEVIEILPTQIYIDGQIFDIGQTGHLRIKGFDTIPHVIQWGSSVKGIFFYRISTTTYSIENDNTYQATLKIAFQKYDYARAFTAAQRNDIYNGVNSVYQYGLCLNRKTCTSANNKMSMYSGNNKRAFFKWSNGTFVRMSDAVYNGMTSGEYWVAVNANEFVSNDSVRIGGTYYTRDHLISNLDNYAKQYFDLLNEYLENKTISTGDD